MSEQREEQLLEEPLKVPFRWEVEFESSYGRISRFFREIKENGRIMGTRCPQCGIVYCPPTSDCPKCWTRCPEWVEVGPRGTLISYTFIYLPAAGLEEQLPELPYGMGLIKLDGADTELMHFLGEVELDKTKGGMQGEAGFKKKEERGGYITDIAYFKPV